MDGLSKACIVVMLSALITGCGHTNVSRVGLLSIGDLDNRVIPENVEGPTLSGRSGLPTNSGLYHLADAVYRALDGTGYDTLVDVEVTSRTGWIPLNAVEVSGTGVNSTDLQKAIESK